MTDIRQADSFAMAICDDWNAIHIYAQDKNGVPFAQINISPEDMPGFIEAAQRLAYAVAVERR